MSREQLVDKVMAVAGGAVHDINGVDDFAILVFDGVTERGIVQSEHRKRRFAAFEREVFDFIVDFGGVGQVEGGGCGSLRPGGRAGQEEGEGKQAAGCQQEGKAVRLFHARFRLLG
jgi:hypothetical protein